MSPQPITDGLPGPLPDLVDAYLADELDEGGFQELERLLVESRAARDYFVRYCRLETDLHRALRGRRAAGRALERIAREGGAAAGGAARPPRRRIIRFALAACVLLGGLGLGWALVRGPRDRPAGGEPARSAAVAWLVNAQDCDWGDADTGNLTAGRVLRVRRGLAELRLAGGARVVLEGPADVELISGGSLRLSRGKLAARAEGEARGFQVVLPQGRVVDQGTEFGVRVGDDGAAEVIVFEGKVEAHATGAGGGVSLVEAQSASISRGRVTLTTASAATRPFAIERRIRPAPLVTPRRLTLDFAAPTPGTLRDRGGSGTGLTYRLPGTGGKLPAADPNLRLDTDANRLRLTTTRSDINRRFRLAEGEYVGFRLSDLGFTGPEDFEISAVIPHIPSLAAVGQFGLYAGSAADRCIRGGLISRSAPDQYRQFLVNNEDGLDHDATYVGLAETGNDLRLTLRRQAGKFSLTVENLTSGAGSTLSIRHPAFLDADRDLYVGLFGANTGSDEPRELTVQQLSATVWVVTDAAEPGTKASRLPR